MTIGTILLVILVLVLIGSVPTWSHSRNWGYGPSGGVGVIVLILLILLLTGRLEARLHDMDNRKPTDEVSAGSADTGPEPGAVPAGDLTRPSHDSAQTKQSRVRPPLSLQAAERQIAEFFALK